MIQNVAVDNSILNSADVAGKVTNPDSAAIQVVDMNAPRWEAPVLLKDWEFDSTAIQFLSIQISRSVKIQLQLQLNISNFM